MMNIIDMQNNLKGLTDQQLVGEMQQPTGQVPQYLVLAELTRRKDMRDEFAKRQADSGKTVAENAIAAAGFPHSGIASLSSMAPRTDLSMNDAAPMMGQPPQPAPPPPMAEVRGMADGGLVDIPAPYGYTSGRSVAPRPQFSPFAMMEWDRKYGATHYTDGRPINPIGPTEERPSAREVAQSPLTFGNVRADDMTPSVILPREELPINFIEAISQPGRQRPAALSASAVSGESKPAYDSGIFSAYPVLDSIPQPSYETLPRRGQFAGGLDPAPDVTENKPSYDSGAFSPQMDAEMIEGPNVVIPGIDRRVIPQARRIPKMEEPSAERMNTPDSSFYIDPYGAIYPVPVPDTSVLPDDVTLSDRYDPKTLWSRVVNADGGQQLDAEQLANRDAISAMIANIGVNPEDFPVGEDVTGGQPMPVPQAAAVGGGGGAGGGGTSGGGAAGGASGFSSYEQFLQKRLDDLARQKDKDKWLALAMAGAQLMASDNPSFGGAIGEAFQTGLGAYKDLMTKADEEEMDLMMKKLQLSAASAGGGGGGASGGRSSGASAMTGIPASLLDDYLRNQFSLEDDIRKINSDIVAGGMTDDTGYWVPYTEEQLAAKTRQRDYLTRTLEAAKLRSGSTDFYATE